MMILSLGCSLPPFCVFVSGGDSEKLFINYYYYNVALCFFSPTILKNTIIWYFSPKQNAVFACCLLLVGLLVGICHFISLSICFSSFSYRFPKNLFRACQIVSLPNHVTNWTVCYISFLHFHSISDANFLSIPHTKLTKSLVI